VVVQAVPPHGQWYRYLSGLPPILMVPFCGEGALVN
jgi:hypothetical protein